MNQPRQHANSIVLAAKLARINEPHVAPLNEIAHRIQAQHPGVPHFDPADGGINARVLLLLEAPGPKAVDFVSCDNDDMTAQNMYQALQAAGVDRKQIVSWNVVPFYIGAADHSKLRAAKQSDIDAGWPWLAELLSLLPRLNTVVLLGRKAQRVRDRIVMLRSDLRIIETHHPSPQALNRVSTRRGELIEALGLTK